MNMVLDERLAFLSYLCISGLLHYTYLFFFLLKIQKMGLQPSDITMFSSLLELVQEARDLASAEQTGS